MAQELKLRPAGLWTNPSAYSAVPDGALDEATNVVIRRPGIVECRPGFPRFNPTTLESSVTNSLEAMHGLIDFPGTETIIAVGDPAPGCDDTTYAVDGTTSPCVVITEPSGDPLEWTRPYIFGAASRKNLYLSTADAVRKITGVTGTPTAARAGTPPPFLVIRDDTTTGGTVPQDTYYSYRAVKVRKDANGVETRSAPSNRIIYGNLAALARSPELRIFGHQNDDNNAAVEIWEIYRSFASTTVNVPDEHFFLRSFGPQPSDTNFTERFTDRAADSELGGPLYTNDDEEGLDNANYRPPQAKVVAEFAGSLVLGDLTFPASINLTYQYTSGLTAANATGIGERDLTGTYTNGSAVVTGVADTTGFNVGMIVVDTVGEWGSPPTGEYTRVISKTVNSVTFSQVYTGATGAKTRVVCDSIRVNARYFPVRSRFELGVHAFWNDFSDAGETYRPSTDVYALTEDVSIALRDASLTWSGPVNRTLFLEAILPSTTPFTVYATHGSEYDPPLPEPNVTGTTVTQETAPGGVMWSKAREPEHFSFFDFERIGGERGRVLSLCKGGDGLWILKEDGIHRMSGADRDAGFRFDRSSSARVLGPKAATESGDRAFAWCDQGLMMLTSGVTEIPSLAISNILRDVQTLAPSDLGGVGLMTFVGANLKANEIILSRPTYASGFLESDTVLVYNLETQAWAEWSLFGGVTCAMYSQDLGLFFGGEAAPLIMRETGPTATAQSDSISTFTYTVASSVNITITGHLTGNVYSPAIGDVFRSAGGTVTYVTAVTDATHFTVASTIGSNGTGTGYVRISAGVTFKANTAKNPSALKLWGDGSLLMGELRGAVPLTASFSSSAQATGTTYDLSTPADAPVGRSVRFIVPRTCARSEQLYVGFDISAAVSPVAAGLTWRIEGLNLSFKPMSLRTRS